MKIILILILIAITLLFTGCINSATPCYPEGVTAVKTIIPHLERSYNDFDYTNLYIVDDEGIRYDYQGRSISRLTSLNYKQNVSILYTCKNGGYYISEMWTSEPGVNSL